MNEMKRRGKKTHKQTNDIFNNILNRQKTHTTTVIRSSNALFIFLNLLYVQSSSGATTKNRTQTQLFFLASIPSLFCQNEVFNICVLLMMHFQP